MKEKGEEEEEEKDGEDEGGRGRTREDEGKEGEKRLAGKADHGAQATLPPAACRAALPRAACPRVCEPCAAAFHHRHLLNLELRASPLVLTRAAG